jgi:GNAT superfamily N-acetyltransferase
MNKRQPPDPAQLMGSSAETWTPATSSLPAVIRPLVPEDIPEVVALSLRACAPVFESFRATLGEQIYRELYPDWLASQARDVEAVCRDEAAAVWVAERDGYPAGFAALRVNEEERAGEIEMIAVDPLAQRQGIGTALMSFALQRIREAGLPLAVVATGGDPGHAPARRVYERVGFVGMPLVRYYTRLDTDAEHT